MIRPRAHDLIGALTGRGAAGRSIRRAAFTVMEMLVVISVMVILVILAVPSLQAMIRSSEEAMAETLLRQAIRSGRDIAIRSSGDSDSALVFFFGTDGRLSMVPCVRVGLVTDTVNPTDDPTSTSIDTIQREVFVAAPQSQVLTLPKSWTVRGYAAIGRMETTAGGWYATSTSGGTGSNSLGYEPTVSNWVFPETAFFNPEMEDQGPQRQTFMLRFQGGTGALMNSPAQPVLVLAPGVSIAARSGGTFPDFDPTREDPTQYVRQVLSGRTADGLNATLLTPKDKVALIGRRSTDMVLAGPVSQIVLLNEQSLARALGVRLDSTSPSVITSQAMVGKVSPTYVPNFIDKVVTQTTNHPSTTTLINQWLEGDTNFDGQFTVQPFSSVGDHSKDDHPEAKLYWIDRYSGTPHQMEVQP